MKLRGLLCAAAVVLAAVACVFFSIPKEISSVGERTAVKTAVSEKSVTGEKSVVKIYPGNQSDRTYSIGLSAWDSSAYAEPVNVIVCLEMAERMLWLADSPVNNDCYYKHKAYEGIETDELYTIDGGEYKQIVLQGEQWYIKNGNLKPVGVRDANGASTFTKDVYAKGQCRTRLERLRDGLNDFIGKLAGINPQNCVGLVLYGGAEKSIQPVALNEDGIASLEAELDKLAVGEEKGDFPTGAAAAMLSGRMNNAAVNVACSRFRGNISDDALKTLSLYCVVDAESKSMLNSYSFVRPERLFSSDPAEAFKSILTSVVNGTATTVTHDLDPRFELTEKCVSELKKDSSASYGEESGGTVITYDAVLPIDQSVRWEKTLEVRAKSDFIGGNRIPTGGTEIKRGETKVFDFGDALVNVPVQFHVSQTGAGIFSGETVPISFGGIGVAESMCSAEKYNFYGMGETGRMTYRWLDENGNDLGTTEEIGKLTPDSSCALTLAVTFIPAADGLSLPPSAGKPADETTLNGSYRIKVATGTVTAYVKAPPMKNQLFTLTLEGENVTQYSSLITDGGEKTDDAGLITLSAEFKGLPQGKYTLGCDSAGRITAAPDGNCEIQDGKAVFTVGMNEQTGAAVTRVSAVFTEKEAEAVSGAADIQRFEF